MSRTSDYYVVGELYGRMTSLIPHNKTLLANTGNARNNPMWAIATSVMTAQKAKVITPVINKWMIYQVHKMEYNGDKSKIKGTPSDFDDGFAFGMIRNTIYRPDNINNILKLNDITHSEIADTLFEILNINKSIVAKWLNGETKMNDDDVMNIEIAVDVILRKRWLAEESENKATDND